MGNMSLKKSRLVFALLLAVFIVAATVMQARAQDGSIIVTWEEDFNGAPLSPGQAIDDEYQSGAPVGFTVTVDSLNGVAAIFDSSAPTGGDFDLGSPNETCSPAGPGVGAGGEVGSAGENCNALNNVLVIVDNTADGNGDGLIDDPGDDESGGVVTVVFDAPVALDYVDLLDQESGSPATVSLYGDSAGVDLIASVTASGLGDNSYEHLLLRRTDVQRMEIEFPAGGAISDLSYKPMEPTAVSVSSLSAESSTPITMTAGFAVAALSLTVLMGLITWRSLRRRML